MTMEEVIDRISEAYRDNLKDVHMMEMEERDVYNKIMRADYTQGKDITLKEYNDLLKRRDELREQIKLSRMFCDGIDHVRELLMDMGFDTEVK